nr:tetratricopeptide repeat protein [uncultured Allomuricauda sp.]
MKTSTPFFFFVFFLFPFLHAQENLKLDSLLNVYNSQLESRVKVDAAKELSNLLRHDKPEESYLYATRALKISNNIGYKRGKGYAFLSLALYYRFLPNIDSSRYHYKNSIQTFKDIDLKTDLWTALDEYATYETRLGEFEYALELAEEGKALALELKDGIKLVDNLQRKAAIYTDKTDYPAAISETIYASKVLDTIQPEDKKRKAIVLADLGRIQMLRGEEKEAIPYMEESLEIFKELNDLVWLATVYIELGNCYWHLKEYDKCIAEYKKSLVISQQMNREDFIAANNNNIGATYAEIGEFAKALIYLKKAHGSTRKSKSINNLIVSHNDLARAYIGLENYPQALRHTDSAIQIADSIKVPELLEDGYFRQAYIFEQMGDYRLALKNHRKYQQVHDSIQDIQLGKEVEELKTQYETEKKEQQITLQEKEITVLEQQASISNLQKLLLGIGLLLSLIGFYAIRQKLKRNKLEKEKVDAELAFKKKELTTHALHLAKKNEVLESLKQKAQELKENEESQKGYQQLIRTINFDLQDDNNWENFARYFEEVHKDFNSNVKSKFPDVTSNELRLMALLKMNLSSKEIANILNISPEGIKKARYRLRKKLDITTEDSLQDLVLSL